MFKCFCAAKLSVSEGHQIKAMQLSTILKQYNWVQYWGKYQVLLPVHVETRYPPPQPKVIKDVNNGNIKKSSDSGDSCLKIKSFLAGSEGDIDLWVIK